MSQTAGNKKTKPTSFRHSFAQPFYATTATGSREKMFSYRKKPPSAKGNKAPVSEWRMSAHEYAYVLIRNSLLNVREICIFNHFYLDLSVRNHRAEAAGVGSRCKKMSERIEGNLKLYLLKYTILNPNLTIAEQQQQQQWNGVLRPRRMGPLVE